MRRWLFIVLLTCCCIPAVARHVAGGELFYEYMGPSNTAGTSLYKITLRLFRDCASAGPLLQNEVVDVGIYENGNRVGTPLRLSLTGPVNTISLNTSSFPCLVGSVQVCYEMAIYSALAVLADNAAGYTLSRI